MFSWLRSRLTCPVTGDDKTWIEQRLTWLTAELGAERLTNGALVLPTTEFFPANYVGSEAELVEIMHRVAGYMDVDPSSLELCLYEERRPRFEGAWHDGSAGLYAETDEGFDIWLEVSLVRDPTAVVATLAHEIGHVVLLGQRRVSPDTPDHEPLTDLVTVFLGLGIFSANSVIHETNWNAGAVSGWSMGRRGYLTMDMYGYALALYALARGEFKPDWLRHLRPDVRGACKKGLHYVTATGDCRFRPALAARI